MKLNTNVIRTFLFVVFVLIVVQTVHKTYLIKKNVKEQFQNGLDTTTSSPDNQVISTGHPVVLGIAAAAATDTTAAAATDTTAAAATDTTAAAANEETELVILKRTYLEETEKMQNEINVLKDIVKTTLTTGQKVKNSIDGSLDEAKEASSDFKQNLNAFGDFHDNYSQELQRVLQKRLDYTDPAFKSRQEIQNNRMKHIEDDLSTIELLKMKVLEKKDNDIRSIICKSNSTKLNVEPIDFGQNSTGKFTIFINDNCLSYSETAGGTINLSDGNCDLTDTRQAFELKQINDFNEYNDAIKQENTGLKKLVTKSDDIYYPFYLVHPEDNFSKCVYVDDDGHIYVKTIESAPHGRFRTSQTVAFGSCQ